MLNYLTTMMMTTTMKMIIQQILLKMIMKVTDLVPRYLLIGDNKVLLHQLDTKVLALDVMLFQLQELWKVSSKLKLENFINSHLSKLLTAQIRELMEMQDAVVVI
jgi:hypothetical protein